MFLYICIQLCKWVYKNFQNAAMTEALVAVLGTNGKTSKKRGTRPVGGQGREMDRDRGTWQGEM